MTYPLFRIDDIGASTKRFEQHGRQWWSLFGVRIPIAPFANIWFFKRIPPFKRWGPYSELTAQEWMPILEVFKRHSIVPVVAITACWVERDGTLVPFPEKFPEEAAVLKAAADRGDIIIANHGLTHCVVGKHLPRFWKSNRDFHREFLPELDTVVHRDHILRSQEILEGYFKRTIELLVPPGNVWSKKTYQALTGTHIKKVLCKSYMRDSDELMEGVEFFADTDGQFPFHDRELKLYGASWLEKKIQAIH